MENHDLHSEFPQHSDKITELKSNNSHFRKKFDEYNDVNKDIHRIESSGVYTDTELNTLRSKRMHLKDDLFEMIEESYADGK